METMLLVIGVGALLGIAHACGSVASYVRSLRSGRSILRIKFQAEDLYPADHYAPLVPEPLAVAEPPPTLAPAEGAEKVKPARKRKPASKPAARKRK